MSNASDYVLSGLLHEPEAYWRIASIVTADDFPPADRELFGWIESGTKAGEVRDYITALDADFDVLDYSKGLRSTAAIEEYARLVAEDGERRRVREAGRRMEVCGSYAEAQSILAAVRPQQSARLKTAKDGLREMMEAMAVRFKADSVVTGTATGLESLDMLTGGWQDGDLIGVGGETSSGKTAFALQCSVAAGRCYYASLEMMASQLFERVVSAVGRIPYRYIRFPTEAPGHVIDPGGTLALAAKDAMALPLIVDDQAGLSFDQIASRARQLHMQEPLKLIVIDHLNLIRRPRKNDAAELGEIAIGLKNLAKDLRVPVMVLVQLNRGQKQRADRRPQLEDFRNSGEIEEALDTAVMVYRDEYHHPDGPLKGYAEFIIRKQRQGERNVTAWAKSYLSEMRFESADEPERPTSDAGGDDRRGGFKARGFTSRQPGAFSRVSSND